METITKTLAVTDTIYLRSTIELTSTILQTAIQTQSAAKPVTQYVTELHTNEILLPGSTSVIYDTTSITSYEDIINYRYFTSTTTIAQTATQTVYETNSVVETMPVISTTVNYQTVTLQPDYVEATLNAVVTQTVGSEPQFRTFYDTTTAVFTSTKVQIVQPKTVTETAIEFDYINLVKTNTVTETETDIQHFIQTETLTQSLLNSKTITVTEAAWQTETKYLTKTDKVILSTTLTELETKYDIKTQAQTKTITQSIQIPFDAYKREYFATETQYQEVFPTITSTVFVTSTVTNVQSGKYYY